MWKNDLQNTKQWMHDTENTFSDKCTERKFKKSEMTEKKNRFECSSETVSFELLKKPTSWYKIYIKKISYLHKKHNQLLLVMIKEEKADLRLFVLLSLTTAIVCLCTDYFMLQITRWSKSWLFLFTHVTSSLSLAPSEVRSIYSTTAQMVCYNKAWFE